MACSAAYRMTAAQSFLSARPASASAAVLYTNALVAAVTVYMSASFPCMSCMPAHKMVTPEGCRAHVVLHDQKHAEHSSISQLGRLCISLPASDLLIAHKKAGIYTACTAELPGAICTSLFRSLESVIHYVFQQAVLTTTGKA